MVELQDIVQKNGFSVVAAVAAIAEHSIAHKYAKDRPDKDDNRLLKEFAAKINGETEEKDFSTLKYLATDLTGKLVMPE